MRAGGTLYTDIFDRKPPLPPLLYAASFSITDSTDLRLMRVVVLVMLALCGIVVALELLADGSAQRPRGGAACLFIAGSMALFPADAGAANYAHFAVLPATAAILWSRRGTLPSCGRRRRSHRRGHPVQAELVAGCRSRIASASVCAGAGATSCRSSVLLPSPSPRPASTRRSAGSGSGTSRTAPASCSPASGFGSARGKGLASLAGFVAFHPVLAVALGIALAAGIAGVAAAPPPRRRRPVVVGRLGAGRVGSRAAVLRPLLVAGRAAARSAGGASRLPLDGTAAAPGHRRCCGRLHWSPGCCCSCPVRSIIDPTRRSLAAFVRARTTAADRVFVWGSYPEVLLAADRLPAGGLVHTDFVVGRSGGRDDPAETLADAIPEARTIMLDSLARTPPKLILDTSTSTRPRLQPVSDIADAGAPGLHHRWIPADRGGRRRDRLAANTVTLRRSRLPKLARMESRQLREWIPSEAHRDLTESSPAPRSHWLRELLIVVAFYYSYELIRRFVHLGKVRPRAFRNQLYLIDFERWLHIYTESGVQKAFLGATWFIKVMNVYYGTLHFIITAGLLMWVYLRRHEHYRQYRNLLGMTTALALVGYFAFPLAPPRLYRASCRVAASASSTRSTPSAGSGRTTRAPRRPSPIRSRRCRACTSAGRCGVARCCGRLPGTALFGR